MVSVSFYSSSTGSVTFSDQHFIEVYPSAFTSLTVKSFNPGSGETKNPLEVKFQPSTSLTTSNYLIIEIPTKTNGFASDAGLDITYNHQTITYDEISNSYISGKLDFHLNLIVILGGCYGYLGDQANQIAGKIMCTFSGAVSTSTSRNIFIIIYL